MTNRDGWGGVPNSSTDELGASFGEFRVQTPRADGAQYIPGQSYRGVNLGHPPPQRTHGLQYSVNLSPQVISMCNWQPVLECVSVVDLCVICVGAGSGGLGTFIVHISLVLMQAHYALCPFLSCC